MEFALDDDPVASRPGSGLETRGRDADVSDSDLLVAIAAGDRRAFDELHGRYARAVLGLALTRIRDRGRAEDATQETFMAIWRGAGTYRPGRGPGAPWVFTVARNTITDAGRRRLELPVEPSDQPSTEAGPEDQAERSWRSFRVHRALQSLPERQREVIELAYWGDLSQPEIAARLQIPLGTVKTRTRAALFQLATILAEETT
jgi:RNA polymerase sigma-70 factor, ECF subfamily